MTAGNAATLRAEILATVDAEQDVILAAETAHRVALADLEQEATEIRAAHDKAAAAAYAAYAAVPDMPPLPDDQPHQEALHRLLRAREALIAHQVEALAAGLPTIAQAWDTARPGLDEQARAIAAQANSLAESYGAWHRLLSEARRAAEQDRGAGRIKGGPSTRMRRRPGPHDVLDAASGQDLCGFGPPDSEVSAQLVTGRPDDGSGRRFVGW